MKYNILFFVLFCNSIFLFAQDAHFSQYDASRIYTNPAFTGTDSALTLSTGYRSQWSNIGEGYNTFHFSADQYIHLLRGGLGINFINDNEAGILMTNAITLNYAPHFELFNHKLVIQPALGIGYFQKRLDWSKLTFGDMIDARKGFVWNTKEVPETLMKSNFDLSAGLLLYTTHYYGGIAIHHLTQPDEGVLYSSKLPMKFTFHAGANLSFNTANFILSPNILIMQQANFQMLLPGLTAKYKWVVLGISYRRKDALIMNMGFQNRFLKIGYSYDYTSSSLTNIATGGSHEIQLSWLLHYQKEVCKIKTLRLI